MTGHKRIIVEYGLRRQQIILSDRFLSRCRFLEILLQQFNISIEENIDYAIQIYDPIINEFYGLDDEHHVLNVMQDIADLHRFRLIRQSKKNRFPSDLHLTMGKLDYASENIRHIQSLIDDLNHSCDLLNQVINTQDVQTKSNTSKEQFEEIDDEHIDSVSCYENATDHQEKSPLSIPILVQQTTKSKRLIPCKYALRGQCYYGDRCLYLHDEPSLRSARDWEKRL